MRLLGQIFAVLAAVALVAPASAQTYGNGMTRGGYGGPMRGGGYGVVPGLLLPAIAAGAAAAAAQGEEEPPPRRRHTPARQKIASPHPLPHSTPQKPAPKKPERKQILAASARLDLPRKGETRLEPREALVVFRSGVDDRQIAALARRQKLEPAQFRDIALLGQRVYRLRYFDDRPLEGVLKALAREPAIASVQPNYVYALADDARPAAPAPQTAAESAAPASYASAMLHLPEAHRVADGKGVRVALIDSAIDLNHPEIAGSVVAQFDVAAAPAKPSRHGAGMAAAIAGHRQIDGGAPGAELLAARAFDETGDGARAVGLDLLAALDWAVGQKARIVNMSFAGPADPLLAKMLEAAAARKIVLIAAAGNDGPGAPPAFPGADPHVIAVSAVDEQSRLYDRANRGGYVALAAPGVDVLVAAPGGAYDLTSGTSVACAEVSGVAALLLEKAPNLDGPAMRRLLRDSAAALKGAPDAGAGLADAQAALQRAR
ncbi:S8 family serine peptidase [Rhodoblastus sp. 17X3]|uniref:S8 family peptidase n=1 Tax=Rhodoblastus sp. 17X3 TaxID=3047026 RepID=UPI0024B6ED9B|nr:S8 family serine peptidase [Rhodoblastus sp. 17X3]MDI9848649.1 S8 family serine peptidase [Rhodoblastus sp. 17X3]